MEIKEVLRKIYNCPDPKKARIRIPDDIIVGIGSRRIVTEHPYKDDMVIKYGVGEGIDHNKNEVEVYNKAKSRDIDDLLCPIKDKHSDYRWISTPYISNIGSVGDSKYYGPKAKEIYLKLKENDIDLYEIETAYNNGDIIAYDYGSIKI